VKRSGTPGKIKKRFRPDGAEENVDNAKQLARLNQFRGVLLSRLILRPCGARRWGCAGSWAFRFASPQVSSCRAFGAQEEVEKVTQTPP
jgi:hypothetical protein